MRNILTEQDTFFGTIAFRSKLIDQAQLQEAVLVVQRTPDVRLGDVMVQKGWMTREKVDAILSMQDAQRDKLKEYVPPPAPKAPPLAQPVSESGDETRNAGVADSIEEMTGGGGAAVAAEQVPAEISVPAPEHLEHLGDYLAYARAAQASDLHLSAGIAPFLRRHGEIYPVDVPALPSAETERLIFEVLSQHQKTMLMDRRSLEFCLDLPEQGRYRADIFKERLGWDANFHVIRSRVPTFEELGLPSCLKRLTEFAQGLVLVTGPSNSGKTTTLAALLDLINRTRDDHVITIEKPVEYAHESIRCQITQREVGAHTRSFSVALRAALREDPDIIMVGELRDLETLSIAITAAETGHLVFSTLPTRSAANTVSRIVDGFPAGQQAQIRMMLSESLRGVISQQLIPRKDGQGVALALEILFILPSVAALIRDNQPHQIPSVIQTNRKMGMRRLEDSLLDLVEKGLITGQEALRRALNKAAFEQYREE